MPATTEWELQIDTATKRFIEAVGDASAKSWLAKPPRGPWSMSEVAEHVAIANGNILAVLEGRLEPIVGPPDVTDEEMPYLFYRGDEPPAVATPTGTWTDPSGAIAQLEESASRVVGWARECALDPRAFGFRHPAFGLLDAAQWLRLSAVHTWRHRTQALAVRQAVEG